MTFQAGLIDIQSEASGDSVHVRDPIGTASGDSVHIRDRVACLSEELRILLNDAVHKHKRFKVGYCVNYNICTCGSKSY